MLERNEPAGPTLKWRTAVLGLGVFLLFAGRALAGQPEPAWPDAPAGKRAAEIVALLNQGTPEQVREYVQNSFSPQFRDAFPMARHEGFFTSTRTQLGVLNKQQMVSVTDTECVVALQPANRPLTLELQVKVDAKPPHLVEGIVLRPSRTANPTAPASTANTSAVASPSNTAPSNTAPPNTPPPHPTSIHFASLAEVEPYLRQREAENAFSGVVLVAKDGKPVFHQAYGLASKNFGVKNRLDTKFNLGSIGKLFTSVAVAQLLQEGKIGLDDPIGKHLSTIPEPAASKVTIRHLLQMRSGWGDYWTEKAYRNRWSELRTVSDYFALLKDTPLDFEPGSGTEHSNTSFEILGALIEKVSGQNYYIYVREKVFQPAGMLSTDNFDRDGPVENLAEGYTNENPFDSVKKGYRWTNACLTHIKGTPSGGCFSTAEDMLRLDAALRQYRLLDANHTNLLHRRFEGSANDPFVPQRPARSAGGAPGCNTFLGRDLLTGYTVVVLSNYDMPTAMQVGEALLATLTGPTPH